jgi:uncharacterized protein YuzB (UPF0349 family)
MKQIQYARKINQFRNTARQVNKLIETNNWQALADKPKQQMHWKLNNLFATVRNILSKKELKKILAAAAFLVCIGTANAQSFSPAVNNPFGLANTGSFSFPCFADMDNDGDLDILATTDYGVLSYYQNTGTTASPAYAAPIASPFGISYPAMAFKPVTADLDNDGDLDILTGEYYGAFKYFQNTGTPSSPAFALPVTNPFGLDSAFEEGFPALADFDNDGDLDLLTTEYYGVFKYYENIGTATSPDFAAPVSNPFGLSPASNDVAFPVICDLDNDGDLDILVGASDNAGNMNFYRNTGSNSAPAFSSPLLNPFGLTATATLAAPTFGDIDNDGDFDLMVGDTTGNFIYFKNNLINGVNEINCPNFSFEVYPNPAHEQLTILATVSDQNFTFKLFEISGKLIKEAVMTNNKLAINIKEVPAGTYIIELSDKNSVSRKKLIIK